MDNNIAVYDEFRAQLAELSSANESMVFDYESANGNKEARSHVYKLRQTKSAVEKARKKEKAESLEYGRKVDAEAKSISSEIESMIAVHQKPLDEIDQREKDRVAVHKDHIEGMSLVANQTEHPDGSPLTASEYALAIEYLEGLKIDDSWEEFAAEAAKAKDENLAIARKRYDDRKKYEDEQEELERLRKQQAEVEQKDHDARIAKEAEEKARKDAELAAKREKEAAEKRELELKLAAETAEKEKLEAERRAEVAEKEAIEAAERKAKEDAAKETAEAEKREANKRHNAKINNQAVKAIIKECGLSEEQAKSVVVAVAKKQIPNVSIFY